jgi:two-component system cell cycle response regulator DivK
VLEGDGFEVFVATNASHGIELACSKRPDVILMDLQMPEMDGLQATRILQTEPDTPNIPVIALSAHVRKDDMTRSLEAGCALHLPKPIDTRSLAATVTRVIESTAERTP